MKHLLLRLEPLIWLLFGQGILLGTMLLTGWILVVGLGVTYWLIRERDDPSLPSPPPRSPKPETPAPH